MNGSHRIRRKFVFDPLAVHLSDTKVLTEQTLRRGRAEANKDSGHYQYDLGSQPWIAGCYLGRVRLLVKAPFALWFPFEMFDCIRQVDLFPVNADLLKRARRKETRR